MIQQVQYLIKWRGYDDRTWEKEEHCTNCLELIAEYEAQAPTQAPTAQPLLSNRVLTNIFGKINLIEYLMWIMCVNCSWLKETCLYVHWAV